jgi:hypothetical protein
MKQFIIFILISTFALSGFFNESKIEEEKEKQAEAQRLCKIYKEKTEKYKENMRDDELAQATLANYIRVEKKYCGSHS